jgi:glycosyltransferase involved in cell wall biosynthesis
MKKAIIVTGDLYPEGNAGAVREHAIAKILSANGYNVLVMGYGAYTGTDIKQYDGVNYISLRTRTNNIIAKTWGRLSFAKRVEKICNKKSFFPCLVLVADLFPHTLKVMEKFSVKNDALLIFDAVEWFSHEEYKNGKKNIEYIMGNKINLHCINKKWNVIAISEYLEHHFSKMANNVVRMPVVMDSKAIKSSLLIKHNLKKIIVYAGSPGRKDYIQEIIEAFCLIRKEKLANIEFHIFGVTEEQLIQICCVNPCKLQKVKNSLVIHGRVNRMDVLDWIKKANYTILIRNENMRYAQAGFPTKVVESMMCGTPVICNLSSDLNLYLKDGVNSIIADGHNPQDIAHVLSTILSLSNESEQQLRLNARSTAEEYFDYRKYIYIINELLGTT